MNNDNNSIDNANSDVNNDIPAKNFLVQKIILDTHIIIYYLAGIRLDEKQINIIDKTIEYNALYISSISFWEIAMLFNRGKIVFSMSLGELIQKISTIPGLNILELSVPILLESTLLPNYESKDPVDRLIIASARTNDLYLLTADHNIIDYANLGYLKIVDTK